MSFPTMEIWKDIPGYESRYQVSTLGNVKSLERKVTHKNGVVTTVREKILKKHSNHKGYFLVTIYIKNKRYTCSVHRLVMLTFKSPSHLEVNHINGDKTDNSLHNLEYVSMRENMNHRELSNNNKKRYGVYFHKNAQKWAAKIEVKRKQTHLGLFKDKEKAYNTFYNKYLELHGAPPWKL